MFQYRHIIRYRRTLLKPFSKNWFYFFFPIIPFFASSYMQKFHHLIWCHATDINFSLIIFLILCIFQFEMPSRKSDKNSSIRIIFIKIIMKINVIKIYIENNRFITRKYDITIIFIKMEYIFILIILLLTN